MLLKRNKAIGSIFWVVLDRLGIINNSNANHSNPIKKKHGVWISSKDSTGYRDQVSTILFYSDSSIITVKISHNFI